MWGPLFTADLLKLPGMLPSTAEAGCAELIGRGLLMADAFAALRYFFVPPARRHRGAGAHSGPMVSIAPGLPDTRGAGRDPRRPICYKLSGRAVRAAKGRGSPAQTARRRTPRRPLHEPDPADPLAEANRLSRDFQTGPPLLLAAEPPGDAKEGKGAGQARDGE